MKKQPLVGSVIAIVIALLSLAVAASGVLVSSQTVQNSGIIVSVNLGVYSDSACTQALPSINWGTVSPSSSITRTVYIENTGTAPLALSLMNTDWSPANANGPITVTWDRENSVLSTNQVVAATLILRVSSNTNGITTFSFNIVISGTE